MDDAWEKITQKTKEIANSIGKATVDLVDKGKDKAREIKLRSDLSAAYKDFGELCYHEAKGCSDEKAKADMVAGIDAIIKEIAETLEEDEEPEAKAVCPQCKQEIAPDSAFCKNCGAKL
ncbi:MAG: zinc ribbon domain-containing protein [Oscillospiraceae bacterium]